MEVPPDPIYLRCLFVGDKAPFLIVASSTSLIAQVKGLMAKENPNYLRGVDIKDLTLCQWAVLYF